MKTQVKKYLKDAGYSKGQITEGFEYAEEKGYKDADELGQLALSRILYSDSQLDKGILVGWEPVKWSDYE